MSSRGKTRSSELSSPSKISTKRIKESSPSSSNGPREEDFMTKIVEYCWQILLQWISFFLRKTLNSRLWKTHGKKGMEKYEKSCDGLPSSPKSKRGGQAFGILVISTNPIFGGLWGAFSCHVCPVTSAPAKCRKVVSIKSYAATRGRPRTHHTAG